MFNFIKNLFCPSVKPIDLHNPVYAMGDIFTYLYNDPTTPKLQGKVEILPMTALKYHVVDMNNGMASKKKKARQVYTTVNVTTRYVQTMLEKQIPRWAGRKPLKCVPMAGRQFNAYYDRRHLKFFFDKDPKTQKTVYTCESVDIVAHELGHALLDAMRPDFWSMQALEIWSFHETFADVVAILGLMQQKEIMQYALKETNGNMYKDNVISKLAEEMGTAIYNVTRGRGGRRIGFLRNANNNFVYTPPEKLPTNAPQNKLAAECHSFGRVFLGAWYEIMVEIYNMHRSKMNEYDALVKARDTSAYLFLNAVKHAPASPRMYYAMSKAMLFVDKANNSTYKDVLNKVFKKRKLLKRRIKALSNVKFEDFNLEKTDRVLTGRLGLIKAVVKGESKTMMLGDNFGLRAQSNNPLYQTNIEVPNETYYEFDEKGNLIDEINISESVVVNSARSCIKMLHEEDMVGEGKLFEVQDKNLIRSYIE